MGGHQLFTCRSKKILITPYRCSRATILLRQPQAVLKKLISYVSCLQRTCRFFLSVSGGWKRVDIKAWGAAELCLLDPSVKKCYRLMANSTTCCKDNWISQYQINSTLITRLLPNCICDSPIGIIVYNLLAQCSPSDFQFKAEVKIWTEALQAQNICSNVQIC